MCSFIPKTRCLAALLLTGLLAAIPATVGHAQAHTNGDDPLVMDFRGATLDTVLEYLSEEAGLVIMNDAQLDDRLTLYNRQPITLDQAIEMLNTVLLEHGYTAVRRGQLLKVVPIAQARTQSIPVQYGNDPSQLAETDRIVTQVIPISYAEAEGIAQNLRPLISPQLGEMTANTSSNALIVTDTEANIRRIVQIVRALDQSISQVTEVRVFQLQYADATETANLIEEVFQAGPSEAEQVGRAVRNRFRRGGGDDDEDQSGAGQGGRRVVASADERTNVVVVSAAPEVMASISQVIQELDADTTTKESVLIYRVKNMEASALADLFNELFEDTEDQNSGDNRDRRPPWQRDNQPAESESATVDLVGQVTAVANEDTNALLVLTPERNFDRIREILNELDQPIPQVLIRVLVSEVTYEDSLDLGVEIEAINVGAGGPTGTDDNVLTDFNLFSSTLGLNYLLLNSTNFRLALRALEATGRFDVLSRPYLLTSDNHEANITVGQRVPIPINNRVTDDGSTITDIEYQDVGIILTVTPQINSEGMVVLDIGQELSALTEQAVPISENFQAVVINERSVLTRVAVGHGQTVVIGGLMEDRLQELESKVPILGDIPLIGNLFKRTQRDKTKTELLLFLTPEIIGSPEQLTTTTEQIKNDAASLRDAVEPGLLQQHLDRMEVTRPENPTPDESIPGNVPELDR